MRAHTAPAKMLHQSCSVVNSGNTVSVRIVAQRCGVFFRANISKMGEGSDLEKLCSERPRQKDLPNRALFGNNVLPVVVASTRQRPTALLCDDSNTDSIFCRNT